MDPNQTPADDQALEGRVLDLEMRSAFQDDTIRQLDEVIRQLFDELASLRQELGQLREQVLEDEGKPNSLEDEVPPHY